MILFNNFQNFLGMISALMPGYIQQAPPIIDELVATCLVASGVLNALVIIKINVPFKYIYTCIHQF